MKKEYRRFNITASRPGDDYGALRQALKRRYERVKAGEVARRMCCSSTAASGQINEVHAELEQLGFGDLKLVGVAKGPDRKAGPGEAVRAWRSRAPIVPGRIHRRCA